LIAYRLKHERLVKEVAKTRVESALAGTFDLHVFTTTVEPVEHLALVKGNLSAEGPVLVRVHAANVLGDLLGIGGERGAGTLVSKSLAAIEKEGRGVLVLIRDLGPRSVSTWVEHQARRMSSAGGAHGRRQVDVGV